MYKVVISFLILLLKHGIAVPPATTTNSENLQDELNSLKFTAKMLAIHIEKWNSLYLTSIEPRMVSSASLLSSIDSNIHNLQERAHVWDTFQLHVAAWNDQLSTLDRKVDIISKGQQKMISLDAKINAMANIDYKIDKALKKLEDIEETLANLKNVNQNANYHHEHDALFGEFAARGILTTVKAVEKKLDRLLLSHQNSVVKTKSGDDPRPKLGIKCNVPKAMEELLNDVSSKVDIIFDKVSDSKEESQYEIDEYEGSTEDVPQNYQNGFIKNVVKRMNKPCKKINQMIEDVYSETRRIYNNSRVILDRENVNSENYEKLLSKCQDQSVLTKIDEKASDLNENFNKILDSYFSEQKAHFESYFRKQFASCNSLLKAGFKAVSDTSDVKSKDNFTIVAPEDYFAVQEPLKESCEDLESDQESGVYIFGNHSQSELNNRVYNKKYCLVRDDGLWTVIQRRDNFSVVQDFNLGWMHYKRGFGNLSSDFWFGNDFLCKLTSESEVILRVELEDFEGNHVWAEYSTFRVLSEDEGYGLVVEGYSGNASDSLLSHNGSLFSTLDRKNDQAPECCPCAESYGGGWWFNSCFECNLNGNYFRKSENNGYFKGIIWETWLGNYSLKKTVMMVKPKGKVLLSIPQPQPTWNYYEDP